MIGGANHPRALFLGYLRRELLVSDGQVETVKRELASFAETEGFRMGCTYVEPTGTWPTAFEALIEAVNRYEATAVVLPSPLHFAALGPPTGIRDSFERATGAPCPDSAATALTSRRSRRHSSPLTKRAALSSTARHPAPSSFVPV